MFLVRPPPLLETTKDNTRVPIYSFDATIAEGEPNPTHICRSKQTGNNALSAGQWAGQREVARELGPYALLKQEPVPADEVANQCLHASGSTPRTWTHCSFLGADAPRLSAGQMLSQTIP